MNDAAERITVLVVEPGKSPYAKEMEHDLRSLQQAVGGYIETVYPFEDPVAIICDEEGKLCGKPLNRSLRDSDGEIYDILAGTFLIAGLTEEDFGSLSDELIQKYTDHFQTPEMFFRIGGKIVSIPISPEDQKGAKAPDSIPNKRPFSEQIVSANSRASDNTVSHDVPPKAPER